MYFRKLTIQQYLLQTFLLVVSLFIILSLTSCGDNHTSIPEQNKTVDSMEDENVNLVKEAGIDIQLRITKLIFDAANNIVTYNIQNNGKKDAINIQLRYTNISQNHAEKEVILGNQQAGIIDFPNIYCRKFNRQSNFTYRFQISNKVQV